MRVLVFFVQFPHIETSCAHRTPEPVLASVLREVITVVLDGFEHFSTEFARIAAPFVGSHVFVVLRHNQEAFPALSTEEFVLAGVVRTVHFKGSVRAESLSTLPALNRLLISLLQSNQNG